jgi:GMP synthase-like glutamine amidotransferase
MRIQYFQHVPFEGLGTIRHWAESKNHTITVTRFFRGEKPPAIEEIDWLMIMGGSMGVYDEKEFPWLGEEKKYIIDAIRRGRKVLGICLGAQLIASALGAKVYPNHQKEIGWFPIGLTEKGKKSKIFAGLPEQFLAFHWHGDTFDLPEGSHRLAGSGACKNQAFIYENNVLALQFHLEVERENIELLIKNCDNELRKAPYIQSTEQMLEAKNAYDDIQKIMFQILNQMEH